MKRIVHLARPTREVTPYELFPDPRTVFAEWNDELAARLLPVCRFDLTLAGEEISGPAVFLFYQDYSVEFLSWKTREGRIVELEGDWRRVEPFEEPPDVSALGERKGRYLEFTPYEIEIGPPSEFEETEESWGAAFFDRMDKAGAGWEVRDKLRIGGGYPCYMQSTIPLMDDSGFVAELPADAFHLDNVYFYLSAYGDEFQQDMQMT